MVKSPENCPFNQKMQLLGLHFHIFYLFRLYEITESNLYTDGIS